MKNVQFIKIIFIINPQGIYLLTKTSSYSFNLKRYTQALVFNTCPSYKHYFGTFSKWGLWRGCPAWSGISLLPGEALVPLPCPTLPQFHSACHAPHCQDLLRLHHYGGKNPSETKWKLIFPTSSCFCWVMCSEHQVIKITRYKACEIKCLILYMLKLR